MRRSMLVAAPMLALALAGCATGYKPYGRYGGYSELQLEENKFKVSYDGNAGVPIETAADYVLLRSAEVTLEKGFTYFVIVGGQHAERLEVYNNPVISTSSGKAKASGDKVRVNSTTVTTGGNQTITRHPRMIHVILCFKERPDSKTAEIGKAQVFDARIVASSLRQKHQIEPG